jgi:hypothetical protein
MDEEQEVYLVLPYSYIADIKSKINDERVVFGVREYLGNFLSSLAGTLVREVGGEFAILDSQDVQATSERLTSLIQAGLVTFLSIEDNIENGIQILNSLDKEDLKRVNLIYSGAWKKESRIPDPNEVKESHDNVRNQIKALSEDNSIELIQELSHFLDEEPEALVSDGLFFKEAAVVPDYIPKVSLAVRTAALMSPYKRIGEPKKKPESKRQETDEDSRKVNIPKTELTEEPPPEIYPQRFIVEQHEIEEIDERYDEELAPPVRFISNITSYTSED